MKASVLINNYNYGSFLKEAIDSILNQTYDNIEIIVYDDGSIDNSKSIIKSYGNKIKSIQNNNFGMAPSLNQAHAIEEAYKIATGEIIFLLDSDDLFKEDKVEKVIKEFEKDKNTVCIQHTFELIDQNSKLLNKRKRPVFSGVHLPKAIFFTGRLDFFFTQTSGLAFTRKCINEILPFKKDQFLKLWPDLRLTREAIFIGNVIMLNEDLGYYRLHGSNDSDKLLNKAFLSKFEEEHLRYFNILCQKYKHKKFSAKSKYSSIIRLLVLLVLCNMKINQKFMFLRVLLLKR